MRTYATALKLDTTLILAQLNAELAEGGGGQTLPSFSAPALAGGALDATGQVLRILCARAPAVALSGPPGGSAGRRRGGGRFCLNHRVVQHPLDGLSPGLYDRGCVLPGNPAAIAQALTPPGLFHDKIQHRPVRVGLVSLGCAKNLVDAEIMLGSLLKSGIEITNEADQADVVIVNTCSFIEAAQKESVEAILETSEARTKALNPGRGLDRSPAGLPQRFPRGSPQVAAGGGRLHGH